MTTHNMIKESKSEACAEIGTCARKALTDIASEAHRSQECQNQR